MSDKLQLVVASRQTRFYRHAGYLNRRTGLVQTTQIRVSFQASISRVADRFVLVRVGIVFRGSLSVA